MAQASRRRRVLFLCTANSCRSQMAEAMLRHVAGDRFEALSAGSHPATFIHPLALETLRRMNIPIEAQFPKSWDDFAGERVDAVITVCDLAARETCPVWPGSPITVHWPIADPVQHPGTAEERLELARRVGDRLLAKIQGLAALDWSMDPKTLSQRLTFLGEI